MPKTLDRKYKIQFGKHKGESLEDLPNDYLEWLVSTLEPDKYNNAEVVRVAEEILIEREEEKRNH